jgi:hypothetical protein
MNMLTRRTIGAIARTGLCALALAALLPRAALAQGVCDGFLNVEYPDVPEPVYPQCAAPGYPGVCVALPADPGNQPPLPARCKCCLDVTQKNTIDMKFTFGAGTVLGGTAVFLLDGRTLSPPLFVGAVVLRPDCAPFDPAIGPVCLPNPNGSGPRIEWPGDSQITTDCTDQMGNPIIWDTGLPDGADIPSPQRIDFYPSSDLRIPENTPIPPGKCFVRFPLRVIGAPPAGDPTDPTNWENVYQLAGYRVAACDNDELVSGGDQTATLSICSIVTAPFASIELKVQGVKIANTGGMIDIPALGLSGVPIDPMATATARRLLAPGKPADVNGDHLLAFEAKKQGQSGGGFPLPPQNGRQVTLTTNEFGQVTQKLTDPWMVLINAKKDLQNPVPPGQPLTDVYACYKVPGSQGKRLSWEDQFGPATGIFKRNAAVCFPASLLGTAPPAMPLFCVHGQWAPGGRPPGYKPGGQLAFFGSAWLTDDEKLEGLDEYCAAVTSLMVTP